jgi:hypothetical protein
MPPTSKVEVYAAIRRDARAGLSGRALERKYNVGRRKVVKALASAWPAVEGGIGHRVHTDLGQHPQAVGLAGRLDDPRQHQLPEHLIAAGHPVEPEQVICAAQPPPTDTHPRRRDLQRPRRRTYRRDCGRTDRGRQTEIQLRLPPANRWRAAAFSASNSSSSWADPTCSIVRAPRREPCTICTARAPGRGPHRAHVRHDTAGYEIDLVRKLR